MTTRGKDAPIQETTNGDSHLHVPERVQVPRGGSGHRVAAAEAHYRFAAICRLRGPRQG